MFGAYMSALFGSYMRATEGLYAGGPAGAVSLRPCMPFVLDIPFWFPSI
jgi:hypothetical protein